MPVARRKSSLSPRKRKMIGAKGRVAHVSTTRTVTLGGRKAASLSGLRKRKGLVGKAIVGKAIVRKAIRKAVRARKSA